MKVLLVSATVAEIEPFVNILGNAQVVNERLKRYSYNNSEIEVLITGVGMVFTTYYLGIQLYLKKYDLVVNAGVAGAIDRSLQIGEVVNVVEDFFYELGAEDDHNWHTLAELKLLTSNDLPYTGNGLINDYLPDNPIANQLRKVKAHTVNKVHGNLESINLMHQRSKAQIESMEGAAFLFCCLKQQVPCIQLRAISNMVEVRNKNNWRLKEAIKNLNDFLKKLFENP